MTRSIRRSLATLGALTVLGAAATAAAAAPTPSASPGAVFVGTNHNNTTAASEPANEVAYYRRATDGRLQLIGKYATGGQGSGPSQRFAGDGLGAGNSVTTTADGRWLLVTNAGSNTVTVFRIRASGLTRTDVVPTGDGSQSHRFPNSVTVNHGIVYVLNSGEDASITGFRLSEKGELTPIAGSTRVLDAHQPRWTPDPLSNATQVSFTPSGTQLVVSIKDGPKAGFVPGFSPTGPGRVLVFGVKKDRPTATARVTEFDNRGPFGFSFDPKGRLVVGQFIGGGVEKVNGADSLTGAVGTYRINADGSLAAITAFAGDHQLDTCWAVNNGKYAFGSNYSSGTISSFTIAADGSLTLLNPTAGVTDKPANRQGSTPLDLGISPNGKFLYLVEPGSGKVGAWRIEADGALTKLDEYGGLPATVDGDQAPVDLGSGGSPAGIAVL